MMRVPWTHSTTPIQKSGGRLLRPSALPLSHLPRVQCVAGFHTWKNGRYGFSSKHSNGSSVSLIEDCSDVDGGEMFEGCECPEGMIRSFSYSAPTVIFQQSEVICQAKPTYRIP